MSTKTPRLDWREGRRRRAWELKQEGRKQQDIAAASAAATGAAGLGWFRREPWLEQLLINDAMVNLVYGMASVAALAKVGIGWCNDPHTGCLAAFLGNFYPSYYPVSIWWWNTKFVTYNTLYACSRGVRVLPAVLCRPDPTRRREADPWGTGGGGVRGARAGHASSCCYS